MDPVSGDIPAAFRRAWRGFGSTVAVIATAHEGRRHTMLATAVCSVSMEPPSLLVCVNRAASSHAAIVQRGAFSLGILPAGAHDLAAHISGASSADRFSRGSWHSIAAPGEDVDGLPWLAEAQASILCRVDGSYDYGTHTIFISRVVKVADSKEAFDPLCYCDGAYGRVAAFSLR